MTQVLPGNVSSKRELFQEIFLIIRLLYSDLKLSFLVAYRITLIARKLLNSTQINVSGLNSNKQEMFQNLEMITLFPRLMQIRSLFLEDLLQVQE